MESTLKIDFSKRLEHALSPFIEMLETKKKSLSKEEWIKSVRTLELSFINSPGQYLKGEVPPQSVWRPLLEIIFQEIIDDY